MGDDLGYEEALLGAMLVSPRAIREAFALGVTADHFHDERNAEVFQSIMRLFGNGVPVDSISVLKDIHEHHGYANKTHVHTLAALVPSVSAAEYYAQQVIAEGSP